MSSEQGDKAQSRSQQIANTALMEESGSLKSKSCPLPQRAQLLMKKRQAHLMKRMVTMKQIKSMKFENKQKSSIKSTPLTTAQIMLQKMMKTTEPGKIISNSQTKRKRSIKTHSSSKSFSSTSWAGAVCDSGVRIGSSSSRQTPSITSVLHKSHRLQTHKSTNVHPNQSVCKIQDKYKINLQYGHNTKRKLDKNILAKCRQRAILAHEDALQRMSYEGQHNPKPKKTNSLLSSSKKDHKCLDAMNKPTDGSDSRKEAVPLTLNISTKQKRKSQNLYSKKISPISNVNSDNSFRICY